VRTDFARNTPRGVPRPMTTLPRRLRSGLRDLVSRSGAPEWILRRQKGRGAILAYHNILPPGKPAWGERSLHLTQESFFDQISVLMDLGEIVPLEVLITEPGKAEAPPRFALTFDDGYVGALDAAEAACERFGVPASIFICPELVGQDGFWWDILASSSGGVVPGEVRSRCLDVLRGEQPRIAGEFGYDRNGEPTAPSYARPASRDRILELALLDGISFYSHTARHPNLAALSQAAVRREIADARSWFEEAGLREGPRLLAYPYGMHSDQAVEGTRSEGVAMAFTTEGRWLPARVEGLDTFRVPRVNVPAGVTHGAFLTLLARAALR